MFLGKVIKFYILKVLTSPEPPLIAFRRCKKLKDILVRARLNSEGNGGTDKKGCYRCGKSRCQVCNVMSNSEHFHSNIDSGNIG